MPPSTPARSSLGLFITPLRTLLLPLLLASFISADTRACYLPNGTLATDVPCTDDAVSTCCGSTSICLSNGFCLAADAQPYGLARGSCTDASWGANCTQACTGARDNPGGGMSIVNVGYNDTSAEWTYCCGSPVANGSAGTACADGDEPFTVPSGEVILGRAALTGAAAAATVTVSVVATVTGSPAASPDGVALKAGLGTGIPLLLMLATATVWALLERRRWKEVERRLAAQEAAGWKASAGTEETMMASAQPWQQETKPELPPGSQGPHSGQWRTGHAPIVGPVEMGSQFDPVELGHR